MWGELASHKRLFNPPPQFSRLGILVSLRPIFLCNFQFLVCDVHICVPLYVWLCLSGLGYAHVFPCVLVIYHNTCSIRIIPPFSVVTEGEIAKYMTSLQPDI